MKRLTTVGGSEQVLRAATHNPWVVLQAVSKAELEAVVARPGSRTGIETLLEHRHHHLAAAEWFQQSHPGAPLTGVAYFGMVSYQQGCVRQVIGSDGRQQALFPYNDPGQLSIALVRDREKSR